MGERFELLDHTSEIGFRARGDTLAEAFEHAGTALFEVMTDTADLDDVVEVDVAVGAESLEALLFDFVVHLIFVAETEGVVLKTFDLAVEEQENGVTVTGTGRGEEIRQDMRLQDVKAPTYSGMRVEEDGEGWVLEMTLDV
ncbi:MAG: archease [Candidatus Nanohaloarchaea archaeon]